MADEPRVDFGTSLRQAREKRGLSLQQLATTTKISARVLGALEHNDPRKLPGGIFSRAFVRAYAREVGLDPEVVVSQFVAAFPEQAAADATISASASDDPEVFESHRRAATTFLQLLGVSLVIVIIVVIYLMTRPAAPKPEPALPDGQQTESAAQPPAQLPAQPDLSVRDAAPQAPVTTAAPPPDDAATAAPLAIGISASAPCWLSLTLDGSRVLARTLEPGEQLAYNARATVTLVAGNAGALALTLNGRPAKPLGTPGQVVTTTITVETLKTFLQSP